MFVWLKQTPVCVVCDSAVYCLEGGVYRIYASNDPTFKCTDLMKVGSVLRKTFALT
jgi:hypothetical protein